MNDIFSSSVDPVILFGSLMNSSYRHSGVYWFSIIRHYGHNVKHLLTAKEQRATVTNLEIVKNSIIKLRGRER